MNYTKFVRQSKLPALALAALALAAAPSFAQTTVVVDLAAVQGEWTPPGGDAPIAMWGFVNDTGSCPTPPVAWGVGPELTATAGDTLTINVRNCLPQPLPDPVSVSVFIPGQLKATSPATFIDGEGRSRVRSFDAETAPGTVGTYTWNGDGLTGVKEGTYLYHSGTHVQVQVQMGLYGALVVTGSKYPEVSQDEVLVYSEIDPALHEAVAGGTYGTAAYPSTFDYMPRYFLINGAAYPDGADIVVGTSTPMLLRFVNAGLRTHVPTLEGGLYMSLIAEDGNLYPFPAEQYGIELQAAKTIDAVLTVGAEGRYALYDRALGLTNWMENGGGMLTYIDVQTASGAPVAVDDPAIAGDYTIDEIDENAPAGLVVAAPGVLSNDTLGTPPGTLMASLVSDVLNGSLALSSDGSFTYTPDPYFNGTDSFTYLANDGGANSNVATATITVTAVNYPPDANDVLAETLPETLVTIDVAANDSDPDGNLDPTTANTACLTGSPACSLPTGGTLVNNLDGTFDYTPNAGTTSDTFVYEVCDTESLCDTATVTITVVSNTAPEAIADAASTPYFTPVTVDVVANDIDVDGNLDPTTVDVATGPTNGSITAVNALTGAITYAPNSLFSGTDEFQYTVADTFGATSNMATVTITVANNVPVANDDFATAFRNSAGINIDVNLNDTDTGGTIDNSTIIITTGPNTQQGGTVRVVLVPASPPELLVDTYMVEYIPKRGFRGSDAFQYTVQDDHVPAATSNVATVRVNVLKQRN